MPTIAHSLLGWLLLYHLYLSGHFILNSTSLPIFWSSLNFCLYCWNKHSKPEIIWNCMYEGTKSLRILLKDSADWREMKWVNLEHIVLRKVSAAKFCPWTKYNYAGSLKELLCTGQTILDTSQLRSTEGQWYISQGHPLCFLSLCGLTHVLATKIMPGILDKRQ